MEIKIMFEYFEVQAKLLDTPTAKAIYDALPHEAIVERWGGELYFPIPITVGLENNATQEIDPGTIAFWPSGHAFCLFFDKTPASKSSKPKAYDLVNIFGTIKGDFRLLDQVVDGDIVKINKY